MTEELEYATDWSRSYDHAELWRHRVHPVPAGAEISLSNDTAWVATTDPALIEFRTGYDSIGLPIETEGFFDIDELLTTAVGRYGGHVGSMHHHYLTPERGTQRWDEGPPRRLVPWAPDPVWYVGPSSGWRVQVTPNADIAPYGTNHAEFQEHLTEFRLFLAIYPANRHAWAVAVEDARLTAASGELRYEFMRRLVCDLIYVDWAGSVHA